MSRASTPRPTSKLPGVKPLSYFVSLILASGMSAPILAGPEGGSIQGGAGSIQSSGNTTTIQQDTQNMAIDWQSYDVDAGERVQYIQPNSSAVSLNRILSNSGSRIMGQIDANGHVVLVNPNGIIFGKDSVVNAGGILASGLSIDPDDFMNGQYTFSAIEGTEGMVINAGLLNAATGGSVALIGQQVENSGLISAQLGSVNLAAGKQAVVTFDAEGLLGVSITEAVLQDDIGVDPAIVNSGEIRAEDGQILLSASVSQDIFSQAVNAGELNRGTSVVVHDDGSFTLGAGADLVNTGLIDTSGEQGGNVVILGENITSSGDVIADGQGSAGHVEIHSVDTTIIAENAHVTAIAENGQGGEIKILGSKVGLMDQATVDVSGLAGGGQVLFGGDETGANIEVRNADFIYLSEYSTVHADALVDGDGGRVITFASDSARIYGELTAIGGADSGNGGFIETSGLRGFEILSNPDVTARNGSAGEWLIDPYNVTITRFNNSGMSGITLPSDAGSAFFAIDVAAEISVGRIYDVLSTGTTLRIQTSNGSGDGPEQGNIFFDTDFNYMGDADSTLIFSAAGDIIANNRFIEARGNGQLNLEFHAGSLSGFEGDLDFFRSTIHTNGGDLTITGRDIVREATRLDVRQGGGGSGNIFIDVDGVARYEDVYIGSFLLGDTTIGSSIFEINANEVLASGNISYGRRDDFSNYTVNVEFNADESIVFEGAFADNEAGGLDVLNMTLNADADRSGSGDIVIEDTSIWLSGGDFNAYAHNIIVGETTQLVSVHTEGGDFIVGGDTPISGDFINYNEATEFSGIIGVNGSIYDDTNFGAGLLSIRAQGDVSLGAIYLGRPPSGNSTNVNDFNLNIEAGDDLIIWEDIYSGFLVGNGENDQMRFAAGNAVADEYSGIHVHANIVPDYDGDAVDIIFEGTGPDVNFTLGYDENGNGISIFEGEGRSISSAGGDISILVNGDVIAVGTGEGDEIINGALSPYGGDLIIGNGIGSLQTPSSVSVTGYDRAIFNQTESFFGGIEGNPDADSSGSVTIYSDGNVHLGQVYTNENVTRPSPYAPGDLIITAAGSLSQDIASDGPGGFNGFLFGQFVVGGTTTLTAGSDIDLANDVNEFYGGVGINSGGDVFIAAQEGFALGNANVNSVINGNLLLDIDGALTNDGSISVLQGTSIRGANINLTNPLNDFVGPVLFVNAVNVEVVDGFDGITLANSVVSDSFTVRAFDGNSLGNANIDDAGIFTVGNILTLYAENNIELDGQHSVRMLNVENAENATFRFGNVMGSFNFEHLNVLNDVDFSINFEPIRQTGAMVVGGNLTITNGGGNINLDNPGNMFGGIVSIDSSVPSGGPFSGGGNIVLQASSPLQLGSLNSSARVGSNSDAGDIVIFYQDVSLNGDLVADRGIAGANSGLIDFIPINDFEGVSITVNEGASWSGGSLSFLATNQSDIFNLNGELSGGVVFLEGLAGEDVFNVGTSLQHPIYGGAGSDIFNVFASNIDVIIDGGEDIDTLVGSSSDNFWNVGVSNLLSGTGTIFFENIEVMVGGDASDVFVVRSEIQGDLFGGGGADEFVFVESGRLIGNIEGGVGGEDFLDYSGVSSSNILDLQTIAGIEHIQGSISFDTTLQGGNINTSWMIEGADSGQIVTDIETISFAGITNLLGGDGDDSFILTDGIVFDGTIDAGGHNLGDYYDLSAMSVVDFTVGDAFSGVLNAEIVRGNGIDSTLRGENVASTWDITGLNAGNIGAFEFTGFNFLVGGAAEDTFSVQAGGSISGSIDGGGSINAIDYSAATDANPIINQNIFNVATLTGNGTTAFLQGDDIDNTWSITAENGGSVAGITFTNFANLAGGSQNDTFNIEGAGEISGAITGGDQAAGGQDIVSYALATSPVVTQLGASGLSGIELVVGNGTDSTIVAADIDNQWQITGANTGTINAGSAEEIAFQNFTSLVGGAAADDFSIEAIVTASISGAGGSDNFIFAGSGQATSIDGGVNTSTDPLTPDVNTITALQDQSNLVDISGAYSGTVLYEDALGDVEYVSSFSNIQNIEGSDANADTFFYSTNLSQIDSIVAGTTGTDTFAYTEIDGTKVNGEMQDLTLGSGGVEGVERVIGNQSSSDVGNSSRLIFVSNDDESISWEIGDFDAIAVEADGINDGTVNGIEFIDFNQLLGADGDDTFNFNAYPLFASAIAAPTGIEASISGGDNLVDSDLIISRNVDTAWEFNDAPMLSTFTYQDGAVIPTERTTAFSNVEAINAGSGVDSFDFGGVSALPAIAIDGGDNDDSIIFPNVDIDITIGAVAPDLGSLAINDIEEVVASGANDNTLRAASGVGAVVWSIDDVNAGSLQVNGETTSFTNFQNIVGSDDAVDEFTVDGGTIASLRGSSAAALPSDTSIDTLNVVSVDGQIISWSVNGAVSGSVGSGSVAVVGSFADIEALEGGNGNDVFTMSSLTAAPIEIDGSAGDNTLSWEVARVFEWELSDANNGTVNGATFTSIQNIRAQGDTLVGPDLDASWNINDADAGLLVDENANNLNFFGVSDILAGSGDDTFSFSGAGAISGSVDAGTHNLGDVIDYASSALTEVSVDVLPVANVEILIGGASANTLNANNIDNEWNISGINSGVLNSGTVNEIAFINFSQLVGNAGIDTFSFTVDGVVTGSINGQANADIVDYTEVASAVVALGDNVLLIESITGNDTNTQLQGPDVDSNWIIDGENSGRVDGIEFTGVTQIAAGTQVDTFEFHDGGNIAGGVDAGTGTSIDSVDLSSLTTAINIDLNNADIYGVTQAEDVIGNGANSTITSSDAVAAAWTLSGPTGGSVNGLSFSAFQSLVGGNNNDYFRFTADSNFTGTIDAGGQGAGDPVIGDVIDYSLVPGGVAIDLGSSLSAVSNFETIFGNASESNSIAAANQENTWTITDATAGTLFSDGNLITFTNFTSLIGGDEVDIFDVAVDFSGDIDARGGNDIVALDGSVSGGILLGAGDDIININLAGLNTTVEGGDNTDTINVLYSASSNWTIDSATSSVNTIDFSEFEVANGGEQTDVFDVLVDFFEINTHGGSDQIILAANVANGITTGADSDTVNIQMGAAYNSTIDLGSEDDIVIIADTGTFAAEITGGAGEDSLTASDRDNEWQLASNAADSSLNSDVIFSGFEVITGGDQADNFVLDQDASLTTIVGAAGSNTLTIESSDIDALAWMIAGDGEGRVDGRVDEFSGMTSLVGGDAQDEFIFTNASAFISGLIDGAGADTDSVDVSAFASGVVVELGDAVTSANPSGALNLVNVHVNNVETITAAIDPDVANAPMTENNNWLVNNRSEDYVWNITGRNSGSIALDEDPLTETPINFNYFGTIIGGAGGDEFTFSDGGIITGLYDGGIGNNTIDFSGVAGLFVFTLGDVLHGNFQTIIGNNNAVLEVPGVASGDTIWTITGENDGRVDIGSNSVDELVFEDFNRLLGGDFADEFIFEEAGSITGTIDGGAGINLINATASNTALHAQAGEIGTETLVSGELYDTVVNNSDAVLEFVQVETVLANQSLVNTFTADQQTNNSFTLSNLADMVNGIRTSGFSIFNGGDLDDSFVVQRNLTGELHGGAGNNSLASPSPLLGDTVWTMTAAGDGNADGDYLFTGINNLQGAGNDTLVARDLNNLWFVVAENSGLLVSEVGDIFNFSGMANLSGNSSIDTFYFENSGSLTGSLAGTVAGAPDIGEDTLTIHSGEDDAVTWVINGSSGTSSRIANGFSSFDGYTGGEGTDSVTVNGNIAGALRTAGGDDQVILLADVTNGVFTGEGGDTVSIGVDISGEVFTEAGDDRVEIAALALTTPVHGGSGDNDTIAVTHDNASEWLIDITSSQVDDVVFDSFERAEGNDAVDTFTVLRNYDYIDTAGGNDVLNLSANVTSLTLGADNDRVNLNEAGLELFIDAQLGDRDIIVANHDSENFWVLDATNTVDNVTFAGFEIIRGNDQVDHVTVLQDFAQIETLGGNDEISLQANVVEGLYTGDGNDTIEIGDAALTTQIFAGNDQDTLRVSHAAPSVWNIAGTSTVGAITFEEVEVLQGNNAVDTFNIDASFATIESFGGDDVFNISASVDEINAGADDDVFNILAPNITTFIDGEQGLDTLNAANFTNAWLIGEDNSLNTTITFAAIDNYIGNQSEDTFVLQSGGISGEVRGGGGNDTLLVESQQNIFVRWTLTGENSGTVNNINGGFSEVENLTGGAGIDQFIFNAFGSLSGLIDGGAVSANDLLDVQAITQGVVVEVGSTVTATNPNEDLLNIHVNNIEELVAAADTNTGDNVDTEQNNWIVNNRSGAHTWRLDSRNSGTLNLSSTPSAATQVSFENFGHIQGGVNRDRFEFIDSGYISGVLNGGSGSSLDVADFSLIESDVDIEIGSADSSSSNFGRLEGIERVIGNNDGTDALSFNSVLRANSSQTNWRIDQTNSGSVAYAGGNTVLFEGFNTLVGGEGLDIFTVAGNGNVTGLIDGGNDPSASIQDVVDIASARSDLVVQVAGASPENMNILNIESLIGNGFSHTLMSSSLGENDWLINGVSSGELNSELSFSGISYLVGNNLADNFQISAAGAVNEIQSLAGDDVFVFDGGSVSLIESGLGTDTFIVNNAIVTAVIDAGESTNDADLITLEHTANTNWQIGEAQSSLTSVNGTGAIVGAIQFTNVEIAQGSAATDNVTISSPSIESIDTRGGNDIISLATLNNIDMQIGGGAGIDQFIAANRNNLWLFGDTFGQVTLNFESLANPGLQLSEFDEYFGGSLNDQFTIVSGASWGAMFGGEGNDSLTVNSLAGSSVQWIIDGISSGFVDQVVQHFNGVENFTGGEGVDLFTVEENGVVAGLINGAGSNSDLLDVSALASGVVVEVGDSVTATNPRPGLANVHVNNVENLAAAADTNINDQLETENQNWLYNNLDGNFEWVIDGRNSGSFVAQDLSSNAIRFDHFGNIVSGSGDDNFAFIGAGMITGLVTAGNGSNTGDFSNVDDLIVVTIGDSSFTGGFDIGSFDTILGNNNAILRIGENTLSNAVWTIDSNNAGNVSLASLGVVNFSGFNHLLGGNAQDRFVFEGQGNVSGTISGNGNLNSSPDILDATLADSSRDFYLASITEYVFSNGQSLDWLIDGNLIATDVAGIESIRTNESFENTLYGMQDSINRWLISNGNTNVSGVDFSGFTHLIGGAQEDIFTVRDLGLVNGVLDGGVNTDASIQDSLDIAGIRGSNAVTVQIRETENAADIYIDNIEFVSAANGNHQLRAANTHNAWQITSGDAGIVAFSGLDGSEGEQNSLAFEGFANITGGTGDDSFVFVNGFISGLIDGGAEPVRGQAFDTVDAQAISQDITVSLDAQLLADINLQNIEELVGNDATTNTLFAANQNNTWTINGIDAGVLNTMSFANFANLVGNAELDTFTLGRLTSAADDGVTGFIDGGNGDVEDVVDLRPMGQTVTVALNLSSAADLNLVNVESVLANESSQRMNTIIGMNEDATWLIDGVNSGLVNDIEFSGFAQVIGGDQDDTFIMDEPDSITGSIDGAGGFDFLDLTQRISPVAISLNSLIAADVNIANIEMVDAGEGDNTLVGDNLSNTWDLQGRNQGQLIYTNGGSDSVLEFAGFANLIGGSVDDLFILDTNIVNNLHDEVTGQIIGGEGNDILDTSSLERDAIVSLNLLDESATLRVAEVEEFRGNVLFDSTLSGPARANTWLINGENSGLLNDLAFNGFVNISGGANADTFVFTNDGAIAGIVSGGESLAGTRAIDTVDLSQIDNRNVLVSLDTARQADIRVEDVEAVIANVTTDNTLLGFNDDNTWEITEIDGGTLNGVVDFSGFRNLLGHMFSDTFTYIGAGQSTGLVSGGEAFGDTNDLVDMQRVAQARLTIVNDNAADGFMNIDDFIGNNNDSVLTSASNDNLWSLTEGVNEGRINDEFGNTIGFEQVNNLQGGSANDTFVVDGGSLTGSIAGGAGNDQLQLQLGVEVAQELQFSGEEGEDTIQLSGGSDLNRFTTTYQMDELGQGEISYSLNDRTNLAAYTVFYDTSESISDDVFSTQVIVNDIANVDDHLIFNASNQLTYELPFANAIAFENKSTLVVNMDELDTVQLEGNLFLTDRIEFNGGNIESSEGAFVEASLLRLFRTQNVGSADQRLEIANETRLSVQETRGETYIETHGNLELSHFENPALVDLLAVGDIFNTQAMRSSDRVVLTSSANNIRLEGDNELRGPLSFVAASGDVLIENAATTILQDVDALNLTVESLANVISVADGETTQASRLRVSDVASFVVGNDEVEASVSLTSVDQDFNLLNFTVSGDIEIVDRSSITVEGTAQGDFSLAALDDILLEDISAENITITSAVFENASEVTGASKGAFMGPADLTVDGRVFATNSFSADIEGDITVNASGQILTETGDITLQGHVINLDGEVSSTFGVINLLALSGINIDANLNAASVIAGATNNDIILGTGNRIDVAERAELIAENGNVTMRVDSVIESADTHLEALGNVRVNSLTSENTVTVNAGQSIVDVNLEGVNVEAQQFNSRTGTGVGAVDDVFELSVARIEVVNDTGYVGLVNDQELVVGALKNNGDIDLTNTVGDVILDNTPKLEFVEVDDAVNSTAVVDGNYTLEGSDLNITVVAGKFLAIDDDFSTDRPDLTAFNATISTSAGFGDPDRPIVAHVLNEFEIKGEGISPVFAFGIAPRVFRSEKDLALPNFLIIDDTYFTEVDETVDLDPAVFNAVSHYAYGIVSVKLPRDQWFEVEGEDNEEDDDYFDDLYR